MLYMREMKISLSISKLSHLILVDIMGFQLKSQLLDNDPLPTVSMTESISSRTEGQGLALNFSKSGATALEVTFDLQISLSRCRSRRL